MGPVVVAFLLGVVQGLTEFFPISSSGHLVLAQALLGFVQEGILLEVLLHVATALVVVWFYRAKVAELLRPSFEPALNRYRLAILAGLVPTGIAGVFLKDYFERAYESPPAVLAAMGVTGIVLLATRFATGKDRPITIGVAVLIGVAQSIAILPGVSRSGLTIAAALFLGVGRRRAAEFSFLLSVPAILGAALLTVLDLREGGGGAVMVGPALAGMVAAIVSGYFALVFLVRTVLHGRFDRWGWYCVGLSLLGGLTLALT